MLEWLDQGILSSGFPSVLVSMSITGAYVIVAVLVLRFVLLKVKAPAWARYGLWLAPLFRLLCPYAPEVYNCFINSKVTTDQIKNRQFTHMDMYPTTLAAMGFNIEGNKLALGTNLFSELPTIIEKYGQDYINEEVQKSSEYLDKNIYQFN